MASLLRKPKLYPHGWDKTRKAEKQITTKGPLDVAEVEFASLGSFWHGSVENAMAQAACPGRQVISLSGDGGFAMLMGDWLSLKQLRRPIKIVVFNNGALGFIELEQKSTGFIKTGTELENPNFATMAESIGIKGVRIEDPWHVESKLAEALAHQGPVVVDAVVSRTELRCHPRLQLRWRKGSRSYGAGGA